MKQDELWAAYVAKNSAFAGDGNVTLSAAGLRKLFAQTWDHAHTAGFENGKAWVEMRQKKADELLSRMFPKP